MLSSSKIRRRCPPSSRFSVREPSLLDPALAWGERHGLVLSGMPDSHHKVDLDAATPADAALLSNLLELYIHDLSDIFSVELGSDGRFGYANLPLYWSEPERRFAFLVKCDGRTAGFALVTRGSPVTDDPDVFDVAEFFVARGYRRTGVGRLAARLLWCRFPGKWIVRVSEGNQRAIPFWTHVVAEFAGGAATEFHRPGGTHPWRVFSFDSSLQSHS